jgi:hypothetical protein
VTADTTENLGSHVKYVRVRRRGFLGRNVHVYAVLNGMPMGGQESSWNSARSCHNIIFCIKYFSYTLTYRIKNRFRNEDYITKNSSHITSRPFSRAATLSACGNVTLSNSPAN